jgi:hypothetical protein
MNSDPSNDAARLLQWALRPGEHPAKNDDYHELLERYLDRLEFRELVKSIASGLGLEIVGVPNHHSSMVLAPQTDSVFAMRPSDYRATATYSEDNRLLDGLIQVAIAATVYPRATDLLGDPMQVRNPVTVNEIETTLRQIVERMDDDARDKPDPIADGFYEAWRVYKNRLAARETKDNRAASWTTSRMIEYALEFLCKRHCFLKEKGTERYRALWRYQVLVQEYAASRVHETIKQRLKTSTEVM